MGEVASQITSPAIVYSTVYSDADQRNHQSSVSLAFVRGIRRWPVNFPHKWPVTWKMFPFDDVPMVNTHKIVVLSQESMIRPLFCVGHVFFRNGIICFDNASQSYPRSVGRLPSQKRESDPLQRRPNLCFRNELSLHVIFVIVCSKFSLLIKKKENIIFYQT